MMMVWAVLSISNPAWGAPETPESTDPPLDLKVADLKIRKRPSAPVWPSDESGESNCIVLMVIDRAGVPESATAQECGPGFARSAEGYLRNWRWEPPMHEGESVRARTRVKVEFRPKSSRSSLRSIVPPPGALEPAREPGRPCVVQLTAQAGGDFTEILSNDPEVCLVAPTADVPKAIWKRVEGRTACTIGFEVRQGFILKAGVEECPEPLVRRTIGLVKGWRFEEGEEGRPYELTVIYQP